MLTGITITDTANKEDIIFDGDDDDNNLLSVYNGKFEMKIDKGDAVVIVDFIKSYFNLQDIPQ
jgi:hypothetical protein